jgi:hypothetical protein
MLKELRHNGGPIQSDLRLRPRIIASICVIERRFCSVSAGLSDSHIAVPKVETYAADIRLMDEHFAPDIAAAWRPVETTDAGSTLWKSSKSCRPYAIPTVPTLLARDADGASALARPFLTAGTAQATVARTEKHAATIKRVCAVISFFFQNSDTIATYKRAENLSQRNRRLRVMSRGRSPRGTAPVMPARGQDYALRATRDFARNQGGFAEHLRASRFDVGVDLVPLMKPEDRKRQIMIWYTRR